MTEVFEMRDMSPSSFSSFSNRLLNDEGFAVRYQTLKSQGAP